MGQLSLRNVFVRGHASSSRVLSDPVADFTVSTVSGTAPLTVNFTDTTTNSPTSWAWDFNNNGIVDSTDQNPTYTYNTPGTYTVKLTATNATGSGEVIKTELITVTQTYVSATGGTVTTDGNYKVHTFTSSGTLDISSVSVGGSTIEVLVVAGGGGGAGHGVNVGGGGGGAGGLLNLTTTVSAIGTLTITVGNGGTGGGFNGVGTAGQNSSITGSGLASAITAIGGGRGGTAPSSGGTGGSGGGHSGAGGTPGQGTTGQGFRGSAGSGTYGVTGCNGGGGGGAGGAAGVITPGPGKSVSITGTPVTYAIGGTGGNGGSTVATASVVANRGHGGNGGNNTQSGSAGGSGIVIVRYQYQG